ncbi:MAG: agmatinase [Kordiimonadaceae bacterium]|nr:agmatinase [Kordiimonadaceae bacterium]
MADYNILASEDAFLGLEEKDAVSYERAKAVIIPFGLEASVSYGGGTENGPAAILKASHQVELFDEDLWCEPYKNYGVVTLESAADNKNNIPSELDRLEEIVGSVLDDGKFPLVLGGEHSLTAGSIRPFVKKHDELVVLHFDAHADLRDGYEGEHYSHAAALRRVMDFDNVKLYSFGIRNISAGEIPFLEANGHRVKIYWAKDKAAWNFDEIISHFKGKTVYLTFDLDGFDSSVMPATGTPEPGGLFWDDVIPIIKAVAKESKIVGADVVELAPMENLHASDFLAAKLCYKILSYCLD